jgi:mycofactocin precursor
MVKQTVQPTEAVVRPEVDAGDVPPGAEHGRSDRSELIESDLLVEDVSIDGMCGVY